MTFLSNCSPHCGFSGRGLKKDEKRHVFATKMGGAEAGRDFMHSCSLLPHAHEGVMGPV